MVTEKAKEDLLKHIGEVKQCAHCKGAGICSCPSCASGSLRGQHNVACSACKGKGSVWIGPNTVQIHIHKK